MDIAKIRKKLQEKNKAPQAEQPEAKPESSVREEKVPEQESGVPEVPAEPGPDISVETESEQEIPADKQPPVIAETAGPTAEDEGPEDIKNVLELLTFSLADERFAFRVSEVEEIIRFQRITRVPSMPSYVCGITSLRGKIIPIIDLRERLKLRRNGQGLLDATDADTGGAKEESKILIIEGPNGLIGTTIDRVLGVERFQDGRVLPPPSHLTEEEVRYIEGVVIVDRYFVSIIRSADALSIEEG